jgi:hypothetical protein
MVAWVLALLLTSEPIAAQSLLTFFGL